MLVLTVKSYKNVPVESPIFATFNKNNGSIGRSPENSLILSDPNRYISSVHALIEFKGEKYFIKDNSTNGLFINNVKEPLGKGNSVELKINDCLFIGEYDIYVDFNTTINEELSSYIKSFNQLTQEFGREPNISEVADKMGKSVEQLNRLLERGSLSSEDEAFEIDDFSDLLDLEFSTNQQYNIDVKPNDPFSDTGQSNSSKEESTLTEAQLFEDLLIPNLAVEPSNNFEKNEKVEFAVFSPFNIKRGSKFILDVWAYLPNQYNMALKLAKEMGLEKIIGKKHAVTIPYNTILTIRIEIDSISVSDPSDTIVWAGEPTNASFVIDTPSSISINQYSGKAIISYQGIQIAKISFLIPVGTYKNHKYTDHSQGSLYPKTAFASYSSKNREEVLSRLQGMKKVAPDLDIFIDIFSLRSGEDWKEKLEEHVPSKNIFYLFWSKDAAKSKWVKREWKLALKRRGLDYISPIPLEDLDVVPPPVELEKLHFSDAYIANIRYEKLKKENNNSNPSELIGIGSYSSSPSHRMEKWGQVFP